MSRLTATFGSFVLLLCLSACRQDPAVLIATARDQLAEAAHISYHYRGYWPNPVGKVDTMQGQMTLYRSENPFYSYDYVGRNETEDLVFLGNTFKRVNHQDSVVYLYTRADQEKEKRFISENLYTMYSPVALIALPGWQFAADTLVDGKSLSEFKLVEMDTTIEDKQIYVEKHIFLDPASILPVRYERRAYLNGLSSQTIIYTFFEYKFSAEEGPINYEMPVAYRSQAYGEKEQLELLKAGFPAPDISATDVSGRVILLKDLRGKKVLLNFSVINCGYCKLALEHLNSPDFQLPADMTGLYINPIDGQRDVLDYIKKLPAPFPVLAGEKEIGRAYGVSAYPTFYLIDENGVIEKVVLGYHKEFLESLNKS